MFLGEFQHTIDGKGRLILPAKFREAFSDGLFMTKGLEKCLFVFPKAEWLQVEERMRSLEMLKKDARKLSRFFFGGASEDAPDKQGRVMIPAHLREYAQIDKDVVVIGVSNRLEVWDKQAWQSYAADAEKSYESAAEELADIGL